MYTVPTVQNFKDHFTRDFPFGADVDENVLDGDITKALNRAGLGINQGIFCSQEEYTEGYLLLSAHYLVLNLTTSSQGISGSYQWNTSSKSVGSVSISATIPDSILANPLFSMLTKTNYGAQYLELIYPKLSGQIFTIEGATKA